MKKLVPLLVAVLLVCNTTTALASEGFPDVDSDAEYAQAVDFLADLGIFLGDEHGRFNPDDPVTRAEMAALICRMLGEDAGDASSVTFSDVRPDHWASGYIAKAAELEIINGYGDGCFGPDDTVLYEQSLAMVLRALGRAEEAEGAGGFPNGFLSVAEESGFTYDLDAHPGEPMARWQIAVLLFNVMMGGSEI